MSLSEIQKKYADTWVEILYYSNVYKLYHKKQEKRGALSKQYPALKQLYKDFGNVWSRHTYKADWSEEHKALFDGEEFYLDLAIPMGQSKKWAIEYATKLIREGYQTAIPAELELQEAKYKLEPTVFAENNLLGLRRAAKCYLLLEESGKTAKEIVFILSEKKSDQMSVWNKMFEDWSIHDMITGTKGGDLESRIRMYRRYAAEGEKIVTNMLTYGRFPLK